MNKALFILSFVLLLSCSHHQNADSLLSQAQTIMETSPDSAIMYIDSILIPEKFLKKDKYMEYPRIAKAIKEQPGAKFVLFASADKETGTAAYNQKLSEKRGNAVYEALTQKFGVNPDQPRKNFGEDELYELCDSIKKYGLIQPIVVTKKDGYYQIEIVQYLAIISRPMYMVCLLNKRKQFRLRRNRHFRF